MRVTIHAVFKDGCLHPEPFEHSQVHVNTRYHGYLQVGITEWRPSNIIYPEGGVIPKLLLSLYVVHSPGPVEDVVGPHVVLACQAAVVADVVESNGACCVVRIRAADESPLT